MVWLGDPYTLDGRRGGKYDDCGADNGGGAKNDDVECDGAP